MKEKLAAAWRRMVTAFREIIKDYPVTILCMVLVGLVWSGEEIAHRHAGGEFYEVLGHICMFLALCCPGTLFAEQLFRKSKIVRYVLCGLSALPSFLFVYLILVTKGKAELFSLDWSAYLTEIGYVLGTLFAVEVLVSLHFMRKASDVSFAEYCYSAFFRAAKMSVLSGVLSLGVLLVLLIFTELIYEPRVSIIGIAEMLIVCMFYFPGMLMAVSRYRSERAPFFSGLTLYALTPLLMSGMVIVYLYFIKMLITGELPKNQVFAIISALFCTGVVIWTLAASRSDQQMGRIAKYLPFVFLPLLILQIVSIAIRTNAYGITHKRYFAWALAVFETVYLAIYFLDFFRKTRWKDSLFLVIAGMLFLVLVCPFVNVNAVARRSMIASVERFTAGGLAAVPENRRYTVSTCYRELKGSGYLANRYLTERFSAQERDELDQWSSATHRLTDATSRYVSAWCDDEAISVAEYTYLYPVRTDIEMNPVETDLSAVQLFYLDETGAQQSVRTDLTALAKGMEQCPENETSVYLQAHGRIPLADAGLLILKNISYTHEREGVEEYRDLYAEGYLLVK